MEQKAYEALFQALTELNRQNLITSNQKLYLKYHIIKNHVDIIKIMDSYTGIEDLKETLQVYLKDHSLEIRHFFQTKKPSQIQTSPEEKFMPRDLSTVVSDKLEGFLQYLVEKKNQKNIIGIYERQKLLKVKQCLHEILDSSSPLKSPQHSPQNQDRYTEALFRAITLEVQSKYKYIKRQYFNELITIMNLMEENIQYQQVLTNLLGLLKQYVDSDEFSFIFEDITNNQNILIYNSKNDLLDNISNQNSMVSVKAEMEKLEDQQFFALDDIESELLDQLFDKDSFDHIEIFKCRMNKKSQILFAFNWNKNNAENHVNHNEASKSQNPGILYIKYCQHLRQCNEVFTDLSVFVVETIKNGKTSNMFNQMQMLNTLIDISYRLLTRSRIIFIEIIKNTYNQALNTDVFVMVQDKQEEGQLVPHYKNRKPQFYLQVLHARHYFFIENIEQITHQKYMDNILEVQNSYYKLLRHIRTQSDKMVTYKYFIRQQKLFMDFDKNGRLVFINQPITNSLKSKYRFNIDFPIECKLTFEEIFKTNGKLLDDIKTQLAVTHQIKGNAFIHSISNPEIEMFFKKELKSYKGFFLTFSDFDISDKLSLTHSDSKSIREELREELKSLTQIDEIDELTPTSRTAMRTNFQKIMSYQESVKMIKIMSKEDPNFKKGQLQMFFPDELKGDMRSDDNSSHQKLLYSKSPLIVARAVQHKKRKQQGVGSLTDKGRMSLPYLKFKPEIFIQHEDDDKLELLNWNALDLNTTQEKHRTAWAILKREGWIDLYQIPPDLFIEFLCELERKYNKRKNPFHNYQHGIAVMQCCYRLSKAKKCKMFLNELDKFGLTFSGLCHDVAHTGRTNIFEVNSMSKLAIRYHDKSVLEQYHAATAFKILQREKMNILKNWPANQALQLRKDMISNILYTDIKQHFPLVKDFENAVKAMESELASPNREQKDKIGDSGREFQFGKTPDDINFLRGMIIHSADFTGGVKQFQVSRVWSERVNLEFQAQYAEEGKLGIPQTPFFKDLDKIHILAKSEIGFFKFIVLPLWQQINEFLDKEVDEAVQNVQESMIAWEQVAQENIPKDPPDQQQQQTTQTQLKQPQENGSEQPKQNDDAQPSEKIEQNELDIEQKESIKQQSSSKESEGKVVTVLSKLTSEEVKEPISNTQQNSNLDLNISDVPNFQQDEYDSNGNDLQNDLDCLQEDQNENIDDIKDIGKSSPEFKSSNNNQEVSPQQQLANEVLPENDQQIVEVSDTNEDIDQGKQKQ